MSSFYFLPMESIQSFPWTADSAHGTTSIETVDKAGVVQT